MLVTVDFEFNGSDYRIERGRSPNVFRLKRDGIDLNEVEDESTRRNAPNTGRSRFHHWHFSFYV